MKKNIIFITAFSLLFILFITFLILIFSNNRIKTNTDNILIKNNDLNFNSLTLKQKIAQMIITRGDDSQNIDFVKLNIGGIFLDRQKTENDYTRIIKKYQEESKINLFVTTDMEGSWNPFSSFKYFPSFDKINSSDEAYEIGLEEGKLLKKLGFNLNFAPISEYLDQSYGGRVFNGTKKDIREKLISYIRGLQENTPGTCKHYPGKGLIKNLHLTNDKEEIATEDLELFNSCIYQNITAVMIGHQIATGAISSNGKPSSVSPEVISTLENNNILIISDEINMQGISSYYNNKIDRYRDLINSGENIILDFDLDPKSFEKLLDEIEKEVKLGKIKEENINKSVKKILMLKGYKLN